MPSLNEITVMGHLGRDPELKETPNGGKVCTFSVATSYGSGEHKKTEWHRIVVWDGERDKQATRCSESLSKGSLAYVKGRVQSRKWEDKEGVERTIYEIKAYTVLFLDRRSEGQKDAPF